MSGLRLRRVLFQPPVPIRLVQNTPYVLASGTTPSSTTASITATQSAPLGYFVMISLYNTNLPNSVTDSSGNTYTLAGAVVGANPQQSRLYFALTTHDIIAGVTQFRIALTTAAPVVVVASVIPQALAADLCGDAGGTHAGNQGTGNFTTALTIPNPPRAQANETFIGHLGSSQNTATAPAIATWTVIGDALVGSTGRLVQYYKDVSSNAAVDVTFVVAAWPQGGASVWGQQYATLTR